MFDLFNFQSIYWYDKEFSSYSINENLLPLTEINLCQASGGSVSKSSAF